MNNELIILCICELFQIFKLLLKFIFLFYVIERLIDYVFDRVVIFIDFRGILKNRVSYQYNGEIKIE